MAEADDENDSGMAGLAQAPDSLAASLALGSSSMNDREASEAERFLKAQTRLLSLQAEHLHEQRELVLSRLRWGRFGDRMKAALQVMTALVGFAVAATVAAMAWSASQSNGLLIEKFSVPPDLAARGLTGEVLAARMLDRLVAMQVQTSSQRPAKTYAQSWSENTIKLDIPETGVSLADLEEFLRRKLGHDTHVSGEIVRDTRSLSLTARTGEAARTVKGSQDDLDGLVNRLSEAVYGLTQPYRYAAWLASHGRPAEALPIYKALALNGPPQEKPWGYFGWGSIAMETQGVGALRLLNAAAALEPDNVLVLQYSASIEELNGMPEASLRDYRRMLSLLSGNAAVVGSNAAFLRGFALAGMESMTGDFQAAAKRDGLAADIARRQVGDHDVAAARATMAGSLLTPLSEIPGSIAVDNTAALVLIAVETGDWTGARSQAGALTPLLRNQPGLRSFMPAVIEPYLAQAMAQSGDIAGAEAEIASTPTGCDICLRTRAQIAQLRGQDGRADYWFARAVRQALSIPFAYAEWGGALLARGRPDAAIEKFQLAVQRGPHFADPLEMWGEALMAQDRADLALGKFAQAARYAPDWGRLHLKWGEALHYAGRAGEAGAQFTRAAALFLTAAERAELARMTEQAHS